MGVSDRYIRVYIMPPFTISILVAIESAGSMESKLTANGSLLKYVHFINIFFIQLYTFQTELYKCTKNATTFFGWLSTKRVWLYIKYMSCPPMGGPAICMHHTGHATAALYIKTHSSESQGQERAKRIAKTKCATNYCVSFTRANVFVI